MLRELFTKYSLFQTIWGFKEQEWVFIPMPDWQILSFLWKRRENIKQHNWPHFCQLRHEALTSMRTVHNLTF